MSQFDPTKRNRSRLAAIADRFLTEKSVTIRCDGTVRFYKLSSFRQVTIISIAMALIVWSSYVSVAYYTLQEKTQELTAATAALQVHLERITANRDELAGERDQLNIQIGLIRSQVTNVQNAHVTLVEKFNKAAGSGICEIEKTLGSIGIDIHKLSEQKQAVAGRGGPFIPVAPTSLLAARKLQASLAALNINVTHLDKLQDVVRRVPLGSPVAHFQYSSEFGTRQDPINGSLARHDGLDLAAPQGTPVYTPSPGVVVFVGWKGRYGRTIIIDHGGEITTLYGHLYKVLVTKGQKVDAGAKIALLGNTGRSTGPHLHYEVHVNGRPQDPYPFIRVTRNVFKG